MDGNQVMVFQGSIEVRIYEKDGVVYLKLEDVARGLGFTRLKNGSEYVMWDRVRQYLEEIENSTEVWKQISSNQKGLFIPENVFYRLAMKAKNATAEKFQA